MKRLVVSGLGVAILFVAGGFIFCGCETGGDTSSLTVTPSEVSLSDSNMTATFTVSGSTTNDASGGLRTLSLPLIWSVRNPGLGSVSSVGGASAVYVRGSGLGVNTVIVEDQYGAQGVATVNQL